MPYFLKRYSSLEQLLLRKNYSNHKRWPKKTIFITLIVDKYDTGFSSMYHCSDLHLLESMHKK